MEAPQRLDDVWFTRDYPVLVAAARLLEQHDFLDSTTLANAAQLEQDQVVLALANLGHRHLQVKDSSTLDGRDFYVVGINPNGLEAVGQWPSPESAADLLLAKLGALIDEAPEDSPKQARLRSIRDGLLSAGRDVIVDIAGSVISGRIPL